MPYSYSMKKIPSLHPFPPLLSSSRSVSSSSSSSFYSSSYSSDSAAKKGSYYKMTNDSYLPSPYSSTHITGSFWPGNFWGRQTETSSNRIFGKMVARAECIETPLQHLPIQHILYMYAYVGILSVCLTYHQLHNEHRPTIMHNITNNARNGKFYEAKR